VGRRKQGERREEKAVSMLSHGSAPLHWLDAGEEGC